MKWNPWVLFPLLGLAATQALACYTVYDGADRVVYQSRTPPVDMSRPLHETLPGRFPGGHLIFDSAAAECPVISSVAAGAGGRTLSSASPLLTDQKTARALGLRHRVLPDGAALVEQRDVVLPPAITVIPSPRSARPSTAAMGAAPGAGIR